MNLGNVCAMHPPQSGAQAVEHPIIGANAFRNPYANGMPQKIEPV